MDGVTKAGTRGTDGWARPVSEAGTQARARSERLTSGARVAESFTARGGDVWAARSEDRGGPIWRQMAQLGFYSFSFLFFCFLFFPKFMFFKF
jgi:hypothetical protein